MIDSSNPFLIWAYNGRRALLDDIYNKRITDNSKMFVEFTRHTPVMITNGPAGLNGSVKGFGFVPRKEYIGEISDKLMEVIRLGESASENDRLKALIDIVYSENNREKIDFDKLISLELAKKHTWENVNNGCCSCTLVYYQPPVISFEVRGSATIHRNDEYSMFANAIHDIYHSKNVEIANNPAYVVDIAEIFDNSVKHFGKKIY